MSPRLHAVCSIRFLVLAACALAASAFANPALTNWQTARLTFQRAGAAIDETNLNPARQQLAAATNLPAPYGAMAAKFTTQLEAAAKLPGEKDKPARSKALVELCAALGAYDHALKLQAKFCDQEELQDSPTFAWRLFESGQTTAAIAEYRRRIREEMVETFAEHYKAQLRLVIQRGTNLNDVSFSLQLVKEHYLRGFEDKADGLGALSELARVLPFAKNSAESVAVINEIIQRLGNLGDEAGREAWEDRILTLFANEPAACASVHLERGIRAFNAQDYAKAMMLCRRVCSDYADTPAYGDAQFTVGLIHERAARYDEAIAEYQKIFPSKVRDHDLDVNKSDDCKNYRHRAALRIADCYEAKQDFTNALSYAEAARDKYLYVSYCKSCLRDSQAAVAERIAELKVKVAGATVPGKD